MANHTKFVSVNLNKSYGKTQYSSSSHSSSTYASRPFNGGLNGSRGRSGGGGGGGMVVLSRPRSAGQKSSARLAVPPPLNLPSLRKEHEKQDSAATSGPLAGFGSSGLGNGHGGSGMGWSKPVIVQAMSLEKESGPIQSGRPDSGDEKRGVSSSLQPTSGQFFTSVRSARSLTDIGKAAILRGEDFPSLLATIATPEKVASHQKQKQKVIREEVGNGKDVRFDRVSPLPMHQQIPSFQSSHKSDDKELRRERDVDSSSGACAKKFGGMDGFLRSPLDVVRLSHTSDWADDERDTSHGMLDRGRDNGFSRNEIGRAHRNSDGRAGYDVDNGKGPFNDLYGRDQFGRDSSISGRNEGSWKSSQLLRDVSAVRGNGVDRGSSAVYKTSSFIRDNGRDVRHGHSHPADSSWESNANGTRESRYLTRDTGYGQHFQIGRNGPESYNIRNTQKNDNMHSRYSDTYNNRDRHFFPNSGKPLMEDVSFDNGDPFLGSSIGDVNIKVLRKKKDNLSNIEFHDPVRDSFEAELERVQRMQEEERKRVLEEQSRALDLARKEEEERHRIIREEKERRQRLEDEAREATWRAEQERLEAEKKAEQQRLAREEEKKRIAMEEERRKEAAHQKLLELEAKILKRQAEKATKDLGSPVNGHFDQHHVEAKERKMTDTVDNGDWEDSECMLEQITSSTLLDSSSLNRDIETMSMSNFSKERNSFKCTNPWRKDAYDDVSTSAVRDSSLYISQQDASEVEKSKKTIFSNTEAVSIMTTSKEGKSNFYHGRGHELENTGNSDQFYRNSDFGNAFPDNENYSGTGFSQTRARGSSHTPYSDSILHTPDADCFATFGRQRHVMRQPRVLPPPHSFGQRSSFRAAPERPISSTFLGSETKSDTAGRNREKIRENTCDRECQGKSWQLGNSSIPQDNENKEQHGKSTHSCDTQPSVSISSPPTSHDDFEESGDLCSLPTSTSVPLSNEVHQKAVAGIDNLKSFSDSSSLSLRDEDEWTVDNNEEIQDLEEYDKDGNLEDEVHQVTRENFETVQDFKFSHMVQDHAIDVEQMVLGFNEGVEVKIHSNDDFERSSGGGDDVDMQVIADRSVDGSYDGVFDSSVTDLQSNDHIFPDLIEENPDIIENTEKSLNNLVIEPVYSANCPVVSSDEYVLSEVLPKQPDESGVQGPSVSPTKCQSETARRDLQFGLFSGPPLIQSPIPAIQIGSIQMPLHLHHSLGMHSSQPSLFQFGQLHYPSSVSQGGLPLTQNMSFIQPSVTAQSTFNMNHGRILHSNVLHSSSQDMEIGKVVGNDIKPSDVVVSPEKHEIKDTSPSSSRVRDVLDSQEKATKYSYGSYEKHKIQRAQKFNSNVSYQISPDGKAATHSRNPGIQSTDRRKRYVYTVKNPSSGSQFPGADASLLDHSHIQRRLPRNVRRTVFRVRESGNGVSDVNAATGTSARSMYGKGAYPSRSTKLVGELKCGTAGECAVPLNSKAGIIGKETLSKKNTSPSISSQFRDRNLRSNEIFEDVLDALQTGFIEIFKQPGIEVPSDEDDFIEVRSKRQMLNDKREQKEKETKAKYRVAKGARKMRSFYQSGNAMSSTNKPSSPVAVPFANKASCDSGFVNHRTSHTNTGLVTSNEEVKCVPELVSDAHDTVNNSLDSWDKDPVNVQVIALTQNQLDDAMKPAPFDTCMVSTSNDTNILMNGGVMPSTSSPSGNLNTALPVGKIQFGAITTPTILPPVLRAVNKVIGATGSSSCQSDFSVDGNLPSCKHDPVIFFEKEKDCSESSDRLDEDAEAAASAIAVAAFCNDEIIRIGLDPCTSISENSNFAGVSMNGLSSRGRSNIQEVPSQSVGEESLTVTLPADLSVEPPSISSWPAFASQTSSGPLLSNPAGAPANFPFFNMNSMIGGPMFAFGSNDETGHSQSQEQKNTVLGSGTLGTWPQCHSGVESFYGPPTGFPSPFINSQGGIPGIQPPQMIFYNPFAPVGQYSLSFMGAAAYIPPGKQPDWKHNHVSSAAGVSDGDVNNLNMSGQQRNHASVSPSIQHLGQVAPLVPMTPQVPIFDMSPFQSSAEIPVQARWPHLSIPPPNNATVPVQLEHYHVGSASSQNGQSLQADSLGTKSRFSESSSTEPTDCSRNFNNPIDHVTQYTRELGVVEKPSSGAVYANQKRPFYGSGSVNHKEGSSSSKNSGSKTAVGRSEAVNIISLGNCGNNTNLTSAVKAGTSSQPQQYIRPIGYADHRARLASPQKTILENAWQRRTGVHGKSNNLGAEKNFPTSKVKQVYVAKQPAGGPAATG